MSIIEENIRRINKRDLQFIKNQRLRIIEKEKKIAYLSSLLKPTPIDFYDFTKTSIDFNNKPHNKDISNDQKKVHFNLPRINTTPNKTLNSYERMKNYKVYLKKKKKNNPENKIEKFLIKSGFSYNPSNKHNLSNQSIKKKKNENDGKTIESNIEEKMNKEERDILNIKTILSKKNIKFDGLKNESKHNLKEEAQNTNRSKVDSEDSNNQKKKKYKKINFDYYLKMQTNAEMALKPKLGDDSNDLIEYIKAIKDIRHSLIDNFVEEINNAENRFNNEKPEVDSEFSIKDKSLYEHKWKNLFSLKNYQRFFSKGLKGKISNNNYYIMQKKFLEINNICFAEPKGQPIKLIERPKEIIEE